MTEVAHGLDALNIETTATFREDGTFELHTPNEGAAKFVLVPSLLCSGSCVPPGSCPQPFHEAGPLGSALLWQNSLSEVKIGEFVPSLCH